MSGYQDFFKKSQDVRIAGNLKIPIKKKRPAPNVKFSLGWALFSLGLVGGSLAVFNLSEEDLTGLLNGVEIRVFGQAVAEEKKKEDHAKPETKPQESVKKGDPDAAKSAGEQAKSATGEKEHGEKASGPKKSWSAEEVSLFSKLEERKAQIEAKAQDLTKMEEELQKQKEELNKRLVQLEGVRTKISGQLEERVKVDGQKVDSLVAIYQNMKPTQAAKILENLNEDLAIEVIMKMKTKNASEVLNVMDSQKAKKLAEKFTGYKDLTLNK